MNLIIFNWELYFTIKNEKSTVADLVLPVRVRRFPAPRTVG